MKQVNVRVVVCLVLLILNCQSSRYESEVCQPENDLVLLSLSLVVNENLSYKELPQVMATAYVSCEKKQKRK